MAENLNFQINIGGNAYKNLGEVRKAIKDANAELIAAQTNFGEYSKEAVNAAKKVAQLKDAIQEAKTDTEIAELKRKIDNCFKVKRPRLVQAVNLLVDNAIATGRTLREDSVKLYKGVE